MEKVGTIGLYQYVVFALWCIMGYIAGGLTLMPSFLFFQDPYSCQGGLSAKACLQLVCGLSKPEREVYLPDTLTVYSVANKFMDYRC